MSAAMERTHPYKYKETYCKYAGTTKYKIVAWGYVERDAGRG